MALRYLKSLLAVSLSIPYVAGSPYTKQACDTACDVYKAINVSYKETNLCETSPGVKSFAGYVHLPSTILADSQDPSDPYNISTFFWYFESRNRPKHAPLTIWLSGGPGASGGLSAMTENGPCYVNEYSNGTFLNPYSLNQFSNVLYIDQPNQVGYSYSTYMNSTVNFLNTNPSNNGITPLSAYDGKVPAENTTFKYGVFADQNQKYTANTTAIAARQVWHFMQAWLTNFREYKSTDTRINYWGESYGGYWTTGISSYFLQQNALVANNTICGLDIPVTGLGIANGCLDQLLTVNSFGDFAYNNTYNVSFINSTVYAQVQKNLTMPGGCYDLTNQCRAQAALYDPFNLGTNATVNALCIEATNYCFTYGGNGAYSQLSHRSVFDIAETPTAPYPPYYVAGYLNGPDVRAELGVPVGWNPNSQVVNNAFFDFTGDVFKYAGIDNINLLLANDVNIALVYGDRDERCSWLGGETISLAANWSGTDAFKSAGYAEMHTNASYVGGLTRQYDGLSFTRVFQAGHNVGYFQPETLSEIFLRSSVYDTDVATGKVDVESGCGYSTQGNSSAWSHYQTLSPISTTICYTWAAAFTCSRQQLIALASGTAVVENNVVVNPAN